jgi:ParB family chromosome partitioning protein
MAGKQSDYLADILSEPAEGAPAPRPRGAERARPSPLLSRESALSRVASGEVRQITQLLVDPTRVRVWPGNARLYANLTQENCRELIDSILAEGGQKVPAVVRRVEGDSLHDYEVIAGTRRHFVISWLRKNSYPDMQFLAQVATLDDEAAFRLADLENRARKDVSDMERARSYAAALKQHYGGQATRMAERLNISKGWLSKTLKAATLPDAVLAAFASISDIGLKPAYSLATLLDEKSAAKAVLAKARQLAQEQTALREAGRPPHTAALVMQRLMEAPREPSELDVEEPFVHTSSHGRTALSVQSVGRQGITIRLHAGSGADIDELVDGLRRALAHLEAVGQGLRR